jgi:hypothetical protein
MVDSARKLHPGYNNLDRLATDMRQIRDEESNPVIIEWWVVQGIHHGRGMVSSYAS